MDNKKVKAAVAAELESGDLQKQLLAIERIRQEGSVHYLALLANLFVQSTHSEVKDKISVLFQDVRDVDVRVVVFDILKQTSNSELRSMLLTACWSSRIDYSAYITDFVKMAIAYDYLVAFEVLTIIENIEETPDGSVLNESLTLIKHAVLDEGTPKGEILREIQGALDRLLPD